MGVEKLLLHVCVSLGTPTCFRVMQLYAGLLVRYASPNSSAYVVVKFTMKLCTHFLNNSITTLALFFELPLESFYKPYLSFMLNL